MPTGGVGPSSYRCAAARSARSRADRLAHATALPNPYHILVSEFMLQQTQVATVVPYFRRLVRAWPTVAALARARQQTVLLHWQGLGYYRRAVNLHRAARVIVREHGGRVPDTVEALLSLPGVGRYTAGAIASIAFGRRVAAVDGNVARVLSRLAGAAQNDHKRLWELAEELVSPRHPGQFNEGLMELGATVCLPRRPRCEACPVRRYCLAKGTATGSRRTPKAPPRGVTHHVLALQSGAQFLFQQRAAQGMWAKLWQMPTVELNDERALDGAQLRRRWTSLVGAAISEPVKVGQVGHVTSHRRIRFVVWAARCREPRAARGQWRRANQLFDLPVSVAQKRIMSFFGGALL